MPSIFLVINFKIALVILGIDILKRVIDMRRQILDQSEGQGWSIRVASLIAKAVARVISNQGSCSVMLTGGRTAKAIYIAWAQNHLFLEMSGVTFYFGDERCVPLSSLESNYLMVMQTLFKNGIPFGCDVLRIDADNPNKNEACLHYERCLPQRIDILLLSVGEDGHIASIFPNDERINGATQLVKCVSGPKFPYERITVTPLMLERAKLTFLFVSGGEKGSVLSKAFSIQEDAPRLPVSLVPNGVWVLDNDAAAKI